MVISADRLRVMKREVLGRRVGSVVCSCHVQVICFTRCLFCDSLCTAGSIKRSIVAFSAVEPLSTILQSSLRTDFETLWRRKTTLVPLRSYFPGFLTQISGGGATMDAGLGLLILIGSFAVIVPDLLIEEQRSKNETDASMLQL